MKYTAAQIAKRNKIQTLAENVRGMMDEHSKLTVTFKNGINITMIDDCGDEIFKYNFKTYAPAIAVLEAMAAAQYTYYCK